MHGLDFSIQINLPTKDTTCIFKGHLNTECINMSVVERFYCKLLTILVYEPLDINRNCHGNDGMYIVRPKA